MLRFCSIFFVCAAGSLTMVFVPLLTFIALLFIASILFAVYALFLCPSSPLSSFLPVSHPLGVYAGFGHTRALTIQKAAIITRVFCAHRPQHHPAVECTSTMMTHAPIQWSISPVCQKANWLTHKAICPLLARSRQLDKEFDAASLFCQQYKMRVLEWLMYNAELVGAVIQLLEPAPVCKIVVTFTGQVTTWTRESKVCVCSLLSSA